MWCAQCDGAREHTLVGMPVQVWGGCMWQVLPCRLYEVPRRHEERLPLVSILHPCLQASAAFWEERFSSLPKQLQMMLSPLLALVCSSNS